jgi:hypothetical protein
MHENQSVTHLASGFSVQTNSEARAADWLSHPCSTSWVSASMASILSEPQFNMVASTYGTAQS